MSTFYLDGDGLKHDITYNDNVRLRITRKKNGQSEWHVITDELTDADIGMLYYDETTPFDYNKVRDLSLKEKSVTIKEDDIITVEGEGDRKYVLSEGVTIPNDTKKHKSVVLPGHKLAKRHAMIEKLMRFYEAQCLELRGINAKLYEENLKLRVQMERLKAHLK